MFAESHMQQVGSSRQPLISYGERCRWQVVVVVGGGFAELFPSLSEALFVCLLFCSVLFLSLPPFLSFSLFFSSAP